MATAHREEIARGFLDHAESQTYRARRHTVKHETSPQRAQRQKHGPRRLRPVSPNDKQLQRREQGWNDRFFYEPPINSNKLPRPDRPASISAHSPTAKERKMKEERAQYGKLDLRHKIDKHKKLPHSKLMPLGSLSPPPSERQDPTKEEKLRFKVLKLIDARETLLYQLSALILCTPVQESVFMPSRPTEPPRSMGGSTGGRQQIRPKAGMALASTPLTKIAGDSKSSGGAMTNSREATRMAQKLATDLQEVGIQCVEALVEWMLEAGAKAEKPPPFLWRGRNYFLKMYSDLDFAEAELNARGVCLDCFTPKNPLLIRPEQKLGRVLAAQSIINEMIEMNKEPTPQEIIAHSPNLSRTPETSRSFGRETQREPQETLDSAELESTDVLKSSQIDNHAGSNTQRTDYTDDDYQADDDQEEIQEGEDGGEGEDGEDGEEGEENNASISTSNPSAPEIEDARERDSEAEVELVSMLDESLSNFPRLQPPLSDHMLPTKEESNDPAESARTDTSNQSGEYDTNNFDADENESDGNVEANEDVEEHANQRSEEMQPTETYEKEQQVEQEEEIEDRRQLDEPAIHDADPIEDANDETPGVTIVSKEPTPEEEDDSFNPPREQLLDELLRWARAPRPSEELLVGLPESLEWQGARSLEQAVLSQSSPDTFIQDSLLWALIEIQLVPPHQQLASFLESSTCETLGVRRLLRRECYLIVSSVCRALSLLVQQELERETSLVSEIELSDVLEIAESVFRKQDDTTWKHVGVATSLLTPAYMRDTCSEKKVCPGLNELINVFYPYLTSKSREKLPFHWRALSRLFENYYLRIGELVHALEPPLKGLLLIVGSLNGGKISHVDDSVDDDISIAKLSVVCDRGNVLRSSVEVVWNKRLSSEPSTPRDPIQIFPFFRSSFGEKVVDGVRVEEGEGRGPLKEWFSLLGVELTSKWRQIPLDHTHIDMVDGSNAEVTANGNRLQVPPTVAHLLRPGFKVQWIANSEFEPIGTMVSCIINKQDSSGSTGAFLLDRAVSPTTLDARHLQLFEPHTPVFEYVQGSESFSLSRQTANEPFTQRTLVFVGWLMASAIVHTCSMNLRVHPLVFTMLLSRDYKVNLDEVRALDPSLGNSLERIKTMPEQDLASLLELEGADSNMSADEYILSVLESSFGSKSNLSWQLEAMRSGFNSVLALDSVLSLAIQDFDLAELISGSKVSATDADFNIGNIFRIAADVDFTTCIPLRRAFWGTVDGFEPLMKRKLVKFITGVDTLPLPGTEFLRIEMPFPSLSAADHAKSLAMLPQAHTCDNTLELPHYWKALCWQRSHDENSGNDELESALRDLLRRKLRAAIEFSDGYGLDGTSPVGGVPIGTHLVSNDEKEESYESLDLPALVGDEGNAPIQAPSPKEASPSPLADESSAPETTSSRLEDDNDGSDKHDTAPEPKDEEYEDYEWEEEETAD